LRKIGSVPIFSRWISNTLLLAVSLAVALALGEGALRAIGFSYPNFWQPDPVTGSSLRPGMEGWQVDEGRSYVRVNSQGLRDREHALAKPAGTYRIAVLGDSYTEALQVEMEHAFWAQLPARLGACGFAAGRRVETVNFGVSGYGTGQELLMLRSRVWQYSPDLVLLAFFPGNDVRNNSRTLEAAKGRPYFALEDGKLVLDDSFRNDPEFLGGQRIAVQRAALQQLRLYQLLRRVRAGSIAQHFHNAPIAAAIASGKQTAQLNEPGLDENVFREPVEPAWREAWDITERLLLTAAAETRDRGARFLLVVLSTPGAVYPNAQIRARDAESLGVKSLFYPEERLQRLGAQQGMDVLALAPEMQRRVDAARTYLHGFPKTREGFGHWNETGHTLAAELIAEHLCAKR
jgi:lysophospholipase L1-like esterase